MKYEVGDLVQIATEPWNQHAGDCVVITKIEEGINGRPLYDFVIPEQRGCVSEKFISRLIARGIQVK